MSLRDAHLAKALQHAPDSELAPNELVRKNVLDYANKNLNQVSQKPDGYKANQTHEVSLREGGLGHWLAGLLQGMKNWQLAGMSSVAVALLALIMLREQLPPEMTQPKVTKPESVPTVLAQNQAQQIPEMSPEKEVTQDAAASATSQEEAPTRTASLQKRAKTKEMLESPIAPQIVDKTEIAAKTGAVAPSATEVASTPESKTETAPAEQELAKQDTKKNTQKDNSVVAETSARAEAAPASNAMASAEQKGALEKPTAAAKKLPTLGDTRQDVNVIGVAKAKQDIQTGVLRILVLDWPANKPMVDAETGYRVELATDLAPAELEVYNQTMRDWFNTQH
jgi:hypothetical protein